MLAASHAASVTGLPLWDGVAVCDCTFPPAMRPPTDSDTINEVKDNIEGHKRRIIQREQRITELKMRLYTDTELEDQKM